MLIGRPSCFHRASLTQTGDNPGSAVKKETLLALELSPDYRHECVICDYTHVAPRVPML